MLNRRKFSGLALGVGALVFAPGLASRVFAQSADPAILGTAGPLGELTLGSPDAPVKIVEYASLTCGFCARHHNDVFPILKERFIDTGKIQYTLREFPLDPLAMAAFMLARCEEDKIWPVVDLLFERQRDWAFIERPLDGLYSMMRQVGISQEKSESCLRNETLYGAINDVRERGVSLGVNSTPTFFINGQRYSGAMSIDEFEGILRPMLGG